MVEPFTIATEELETVEDRPQNRTVVGRYELKAVVGRGPHGVVWRARHGGTRQECAIKVFAPELAGDGRLAERLSREQDLLTTFVHPAFVRFRELVVDGGHLALVSELIPGRDLRGRLADSGPLPVRHAVAVTAACADALAGAHDLGVVHSGLKPANILVVDGSGDVRITDSQIARLATPLADRSHRGTDPRYAAPELLSTGAAVRAGDIYSLGVILHELLSGALPGDRPSLTPDVIGGDVWELLVACLAADPQDRPDAAGLAAQLRAWTPATRPAPAPAAGGAPPVVQRVVEPNGTGAGRRRARSVQLAVTFVAIVVLTVAALLLTLPRAHTGNAADTTRAGAPQTFASVSAPPEAADQTAAGAESFVRYWFDTLTYAAQTGDTGPLSTASGPNCAVCGAANATLRQPYQNGGAIRGGTYTVRSVHLDSFLNLARPTLRIVYDRSPRTVVNAAGQDVANLSGTTFANCWLTLERADGRWRVAGDDRSTEPLA